MEALLSSVGLAYLAENFKKHKIGIQEASKLDDQQLNELGVQTVGEKIRLKEKLKEGTTETGVPLPSHRDAVSLFRPSRSRIGPKRKTPTRSWTGNFFCFIDRNTFKIPGSTEKSILQKAGLGNKKIQFLITDNAETVTTKIKCEFPKLLEGGGFEILRCLPNCRNLSVIDCNWDANSLRSTIGGQAEIYIRPIQKNLPIDDLETISREEITEMCSICSGMFNVRELRKHIDNCDNSQIIIEPNSAIGGGSATSATGNELSTLLFVEDDTVADLRFIQYSLPDIEPGDVSTSQFGETSEATSHSELNIQSTEAIGSTEVVTVDTVVAECVAYCQAQNVTDPVAILKIFQTMLVTGRPLELNEETAATGIEGDTNYILIDRASVVKTAFEEIGSITDLRKCLEVQFYAEAAVDYGGPRKEFFSLVLQHIQKQFFDPVREWSSDYEVIGKIMALSTVQNGRLPRIMSEELVQELFVSTSPRPFVLDLKKGLSSLGIIQLANGIPTFIHLFTPTQATPLSLKLLTNLLKPNFSVEGSNRREQEASVYSSFIKYMREAASGKRGAVNLGSILKFATGTEEEPVLGFVIHPSIYFAECQTVLPTANTCVNRLTLTRPHDRMQMPSQEELFSLYDIAFCNSYFGLE